MKAFKEYGSIEEYEFAVLEEVENLKTPITTNEEINIISELIKEPFGMIEFLGEHKNSEIWRNISVERVYNSDYTPTWKRTEGIIVMDKQTKYDKDKRYLKEGVEIKPYIFEGEFHDRIKQLLEEYLDDQRNILEKFNERTSKLWRIKFDKSHVISLMELNSVEEVNEAYNKLLQEAEEELGKELEKERLEEEQTQKKQAEQTDNHKQMYENFSQYEGDIGYLTIKIDGKKIYLDGIRFELEKDVSKLLPYSWWADINRGYYNGDLPILCYYLNKREISYSFYKENKYLRAKVEFDKDKLKGLDKLKVDGVDVPKSKIVFFLKRADGTKETINKLKKLTARAVDLLEKKEIHLYRYSNNNMEFLDINIPFTAETDDGKEFKINLLAKDFICSFDDLKETFYGNSQTFSCDLVKLSHFVTKLGATKKEFFEHIKRVKLLGDLDENS
jgi:hypothetical protein